MEEINIGDLVQTTDGKVRVYVSAHKGLRNARLLFHRHRTAHQVPGKEGVDRANPHPRTPRTKIK